MDAPHCFAAVPEFKPGCVCVRPETAEQPAVALTKPTQQSEGIVFARRDKGGKKGFVRLRDDGYHDGRWTRGFSYCNVMREGGDHG
jgi:hypothetical protein